MTEHYQGSDGKPTGDPAPQPGGNEKKCDPLDNPKKPDDPKKPERCKVPECCTCPTPPTDPGNCLEDLIRDKTEELAKAEKTKQFKADLEALLTKAQAAKQEYTQEKYDKLLKQWIEEDEQIADLIRKLVCTIPCWDCVIECYICPLLDNMRMAEEELYGDESLIKELHNLYDALYWYTRDKDAKERRFNRIKSVLAAWEKPAQTIEKILADNAKLIADLGKSLDVPKIVFDVFLRLVPMHLAIAPPASVAKTKIAKKYTVFCECD